MRRSIYPPSRTHLLQKKNVQLKIYKFQTEYISHICTQHTHHHTHVYNKIKYHNNIAEIDARGDVMRLYGVVVVVVVAFVCARGHSCNYKDSLLSNIFYKCIFLFAVVWVRRERAYI